MKTLNSQEEKQQQRQLLEDKILKKWRGERETQIINRKYPAIELLQNIVNVRDLKLFKVIKT